MDAGAKGVNVHLGPAVGPMARLKWHAGAIPLSTLRRVVIMGFTSHTRAGAIWYQCVDQQRGLPEPEEAAMPQCPMR